MPDEIAQTGLSDTAACGLAYVTIIPAIIFLVVAPYNQKSEIRFHCWQSISLGIVWFAISMIAIIPILGWLIFSGGFADTFCRLDHVHCEGVWRAALHDSCHW